MKIKKQYIKSVIDKTRYPMANLEDQKWIDVIINNSIVSITPLFPYQYCAILRNWSDLLNTGSPMLNPMLLIVG